jgi:hypothetical protein
MTSCAPLRGIALSEERQLNGHRVRLRLVEEYDLALLAESPDDAKARAEADLRNRSGASDLFRSDSRRRPVAATDRSDESLGVRSPGLLRLAARF